jgi:hypothetical protein
MKWSGSSIQASAQRLSSFSPPRPASLHMDMLPIAAGCREQDPMVRHS